MVLRRSVNWFEVSIQDYALLNLAITNSDHRSLPGETPAIPPLPVGGGMCSSDLRSPLLCTGAPSEIQLALYYVVKARNAPLGKTEMK